MARITALKKDQVLLWIEEWAVWLQLQRFRIEVKFHNTKDPNTIGQESVFADVEHHYSGLEADVNIWLPFWKLTDYQKERVLVHELIHVMLPSATEDETCTATEVVWCLVKGEVPCGDSPDCAS